MSKFSNPLNRQWFYRGFKKYMEEDMSVEQADKIWKEAGKEYQSIVSQDPKMKKHKGSMVLPAVALYRALKRHNRDVSLLTEYGVKMGQSFGKAVHIITSIPGVSNWIWKHAAALADTMSSEKKGYKRRLVNGKDAVGVDILSCPYHELSKALGNEEAVLCICAMDKEYSKGFHHIRYDRNSSLGEGDDNCMYRLKYDPFKK